MRPMFLNLGGITLNLFLDPFFMIILDLGTAGAALATLLAKAIPAMVAFRTSVQKENDICPNRAYMRLQKEISVMAFWCFYQWRIQYDLRFVQGTGHTEVTMAIDVTRLWVFRFLTLWFCESVLHMGVRSVWYSVVISNGISALILYVLYRCGIWKKTRIKVGKEEAT